MPVSSQRLVGLLADPARRRVVAALELHEGPATAGVLAEMSGLSLREVVDALDRLGEIVERVGDRHTLDGGVFAEAARFEAAPRRPSSFSDQPDNVARVLDTAFRDGLLVQLPSKRAKRLMVLDHLAQRFEIGRHYPEADVNAMLGKVHDDVAMLRRWLVDEQFLDRSGGMYWRCGGTV